MERRQWRSAVHNSAKKHEAYRIATAEQRRKDRKDFQVSKHFQVSQGSHYPLSILLQNLSSADWPDKSSPYTQN